MCPEVDSASESGRRPTTLVVPKRQGIRDLNLPGTPWPTSACLGRPLPLLYLSLVCRKQIFWLVLITSLMHIFNVFISLLYMFRGTQCSSSGESIVSIHHLVYITVCRWPCGMQVSDLHTTRPPTHSDIYQMMYWYNWFSWWWALDCSKNVEKWNKHMKKCIKLVINTNSTEKHGQRKYKIYCYLQFSNWIRSPQNSLANAITFRPPPRWKTTRA